jgi:hypothetical protein
MLFLIPVRELLPITPLLRQANILVIAAGAPA